jgi:hypothetical protein
VRTNALRASTVKEIAKVQSQIAVANQINSTERLGQQLSVTNWRGTANQLVERDNAAETAGQRIIKLGTNLPGVNLLATFAACGRFCCKSRRGEAVDELPDQRAQTEESA